MKIGNKPNEVPTNADLGRMAFVDSIPPTSQVVNKVINGAMLVDQRNSGNAQLIIAGSTLVYTVDRFYAYCTGANTTGQQVTGTIANTKRYRITGNASVTAVGFGTRLEAVDTAMLSNKEATLQVKLSSSSLTTITWYAYRANTNDTFGTLESPTKAQIATGTFTINATESIYTAKINIPQEATTGLEIVFTGGALGAAQTLTIGDIQLEEGDVASNFEYTFMSDTLLRCQRYFQWVSASIYFYAYTNGETYGPTIMYPVKMRIIPAVGVLVGDPDGTAVSSNVGSLIGFNPTTTYIILSVSATVVGHTSAYYYRIPLSAEL